MDKSRIKDKKYTISGNKLNVEDLLEESEEEDDEEFLELYKKGSLNKHSKLSNINAASTSLQPNTILNQQPKKLSDKDFLLLGSGSLSSLNSQIKSDNFSQNKPSQNLTERADSLLQPQNILKPISTQQYLQSSVKRQELSNYHHHKLLLSDLLNSDDDEEEVESNQKKGKQQLQQQIKAAMSDEEDEENIENFINKVTKKQTTQPSNKVNEQKNQKTMNQQIQAKDILEIIDKNEKMNEVGLDKASEQPAQLLSFDKKFYQVNRKLFQYNDYPEIVQKLFFKRDHQFSGVPSCLSVVQDYLFVGNQMGIIRAFDLKTQKEMKPLKDEQIIGQNNKVTSIEISFDGGYLISGYKGGQIAIWDLVNYKLIKFISDLHTSEITNAKIYHTDENESLYALSAEDIGRVQLIKFTKKNFIGGYNSEAQFLFKQRLQATTSISLQKRNDLYPHAYCDQSSLVAFGSLREVVICQMRPRIKEIFQISKPSFCKENSIPYLDWGYGLTPKFREKTVPILAIAWDSLIQLFHINDQTQTIELDGFYYQQDCEINSLYFIGDSILFALVNRTEIKVLYTTKFYPGHYSYLESKREEGESRGEKFRKVMETTVHAELESRFDIQDIKFSFVQGQAAMNFTQTIKKYKNQIFFLGQKSLVRGKVFAWREYLDHIKYKENADWSAVLRAALEIYNGEVKGFARVPDEKEVREGLLGSFMKDMIKESVQQAIFKYVGSNQIKGNHPSSIIKDETKTQSSTSLQWDLIAIKSAIEFCLAINSTQLLFTDVMELFASSGLETKFLLNLEPFILSGSFRKQTIPDFIIKKLVLLYEQNHNLKVLEKMIMQLDLSEYSYKPELLTNGCMQLLNTLLNLFRKQDANDKQKDDVLMILQTDSDTKYEIEKSKIYLGYKILWIFKLFIEGKNFPSGSMQPVKHREHIYDMVKFISNEQNLDELLDFDSEQFFQIISKLFQGQPLRYLKTQQEFYERNGIDNYILCLQPEDIINDIFFTHSKNNKDKLINFYKFVITVQGQQHDENNPRIEISNEMVENALINVIKTYESKEVQVENNENMMIKAIQSKNFGQDIIQKISKELDFKASQMVHLRVFLLEQRGDYINSFRLNLQNQELRSKIFQWIAKTIENLIDDNEQLPMFQALQKEIQGSIQTLLDINILECVHMVDQYFDEVYQEKLIMEELETRKDIQYNYLKNLVTENEKYFSKTIEEALIDLSKREEAQRCIRYLKKLTELLCQYNEEQVVEYVKKDYYPIRECLEVCIKYQNLNAIAVLHKRNGDYMESLNTYLLIIDQQIDIVQLMNEVCNFQRQKDIPIAIHEKLFSIGFLSQESKYLTLHKFDVLLNEAIQIAEQNGVVLGEQSWFRICQFINGYIIQAPQKVQNLLKKRDVDDNAKIDRLIDYLEQRKQIVLKNLPENISLQRLCDKLNLDFKEINAIYENKVHDFRENLKYLKLAKKVQQVELNAVQTEYLQDVKQGSRMKEHKSYCNCNQLKISNLQKQPLLFFNCNHVYHQNCLPKNSQTGEIECKSCSKKNFEIVSKNESKKGQSHTARVKEEKENEEKVKKAKQLAQSLINTAIEKENDPDSENILLIRRMEVFDQQVLVAGLQKNSFY